MSQPRRRFSVFQRNHKVTVGPLGLDVPILHDPTAFPNDDQVDDEDKLSDVDYPSRGSEFERSAKRRRIEANARNYLCGQSLDVYSASLKGPFTRNYWGETTKVTGTPLELKAVELKESIVKSKREARRQLAKKLASQSQEHSQVRITTTFRAAKSIQTPIKTVSNIPFTETPQYETVASIISENNGELGKAYTSKASEPVLPISLVVSETQESTIQSPSSTQDEPLVLPDTVPKEPKEQLPEEPKAIGTSAIVPGVDPTPVSQGEPPRTHSTGASELLINADLQEPSQDNQCLIADTALESMGPIDGTSIELKETVAAHVESTKEFVPDFDLERIEQLTAQLDADDSSTVFRNDSEPRRKRGQSPATVLKASLPKVPPNKVKSIPAPPSPTTDAILRKATRPPVPKRRSDIGHSKSLKDIIAMTSAGPISKRKSNSYKTRVSLQKLSDAKGKLAPNASDTPPGAPELITEPPRPQGAPSGEAGPAANATTSSIEKPPSLPEDPSALSAPSTEPETQRDAAPANGPGAAEPKPALRLSQMPTPLPPSPLKLLSTTQQTAPNIPEAVEEEIAEKPLPLDTSLKENEPTFNPGPRRAKRTAPRPRPSRPAAAQPSSNEELKAAITAREKIATPISRLQQKIAEFSPVSPMTARPISPVTETQPQPENENSSLRLQEKLREEQQKGSSQLSSPPPSSPVGVETPALATVLNDPVVEVPASSKGVEANTDSVNPTNSNKLANGAPPSPPNDHPREDESTIEMSSGQYRRIEESLRNATPIALPPATNDILVSHVSNSHLEEQNRVIPAEDNQPTNSENLDPPTPKPISKELTPVPETPKTASQASQISVPESFKMAITAPINFTYQTPGAPLPPPFVLSTISGFTPINTNRIAMTSPEQSPTPTARKSAGPFTSPAKTIEFTPFRSINSPQPHRRRESRGSNGDASVLEATTIVSPFTFSQLMKPTTNGDSQGEVSRLREAQRDSQKETQSSYDLENVLGGVEDYLMSDVYDIEEDARRLTAEGSL
ncbi:hypothetical protein ABW19_dt0201975 [Dactylella cylindrospora]|nr:hypothetical protein ABW19_dt0201975 [Dactylella cylindrospora]